MRILKGIAYGCNTKDAILYDDMINGFGSFTVRKFP
jgi:hypothetical protein